MVCFGCGRLTIFKRYCTDCERNEMMFRWLPNSEILRMHLPRNELPDFEAGIGRLRFKPLRSLSGLKRCFRP